MTKVKFTQKEDEMLRNLVAEYVNQNNKINYDEIAKKMNKTKRQVKERYEGYLSPNLNINKEWTKEEDELIEKLVNQFGKKWKRMEPKFPDRSNVMIKNRYNYHLHNYREERRKAEQEKIKKEMEERQNKENTEKITVIDPIPNPNTGNFTEQIFSDEHFETFNFSLDENENF